MKYSILMLHRTDSQFNLPFSQYWFVFHVYRWFSRPDRNCIHRWCWSRDLKKKHWTCRRLHNCWSISCAIALQYVSKLLTTERWLHINYMSDRNCSKVKKANNANSGFNWTFQFIFLLYLPVLILNKQSRSNVENETFGFTWTVFFYYYLQSASYILPGHTSL